MKRRDINSRNVIAIEAMKLQEGLHVMGTGMDDNTAPMHDEITGTESETFPVLKSDSEKKATDTNEEVLL